MQSDKQEQSFRKQITEKSPSNIISMKKNLNDLKFLLKQKNQEIEQLKQNQKTNKMSEFQDEINQYKKEI